METISIRVGKQRKSDSHTFYVTAKELDTIVTAARWAKATGENRILKIKQNGKKVRTFRITQRSNITYL
jgi:Holliday junction resolvase